MKLKALTNDTLIIILKSGDSISGKTSMIPSADSLNIIHILLKKSAEDLEEIMIKPSGYYKRGDTTIFLSDNFKQKEDLALKDLLQRIPNLQLLDNGSITYKGKKVSRIKLQGEELFADQLQLLTNHIPVHVLNSVEIIENTPPQKILKGLRKNGEVFINLTLKEKYSGKFWGSLLAGLGSDSSLIHQLNPVLFSLRSKLNFGLISSMSSTGIIADKTELLQIKTPNLLALIPVTGQQPDLLVPFENSARYFNRNKLGDHRLQVTGQIFKNTKLSFESRYLQERTLQNSSVFTTRLSDSLFNKQTWVSSKKWDPAFFYAKAGYTFEKEQHHLFISILWHKSKDGLTETSQLTEQGSSLAYKQNQSQEYETKKAEINWTKRISSELANRLSITFENTYFLRNAKYQFSEGASVFNLSADEALLLNQTYNLQLTGFHSSFEKIVSSGKVSRPFKWELDWKLLRLNSILNAFQDPSNLYPLRIEEYSSADYFGTGNLGAEKAFEKKIAKGFCKIKGRIGLGLFHLKDRTIHSQITITPIILLQHEVEKNFDKAGTFHLHLQFSQGNSEILKLNQHPYPLQGLNYTAYTKPVLQQRSLYINANLYGKMGKKLLPQGEFAAAVQLLTPLLITTIKGPLTVTHISMISKPGVNVQIGGHIQWIVRKQSPVLKASIKSGFQEFYFLTGSRITKFRNGFFQTEIKAEWQPVKFLQIRVHTHLDFRFSMVRPLALSKQDSKNLQYRQEIKIIWQISKQVHLEYAGIQIRNNARKQAFLNTIFSEAAFRWKTNQHISLHLEVYNLFNLNSFSINNQNYGYLQSNLNLPVVPRQFIAGFRCFF